MKKPKPYIVDVPLDLNELWVTCEQDLLDTMPDHIREQIVQDGIDARAADQDHCNELRRSR